MSAQSLRNSRNELSFSTALPSWLDFGGALASLGAVEDGPTLKLFFGGGTGISGISSSSSSRSSSLIKSSSSIILRAGVVFLAGFLLLPPEQMTKITYDNYDLKSINQSVSQSVHFSINRSKIK